MRKILVGERVEGINTSLNSHNRSNIHSVEAPPITHEGSAYKHRGSVPAREE
jgi:hypothetical protein